MRKYLRSAVTVTVGTEQLRGENSPGGTFRGHHISSVVNPDAEQARRDLQTSPDTSRPSTNTVTQTDILADP